MELFGVFIGILIGIIGCGVVLFLYFLEPGQTSSLYDLLKRPIRRSSGSDRMSNGDDKLLED